MQAAILAMQANPRGEEDDPFLARDNMAREAEARHALAIAEALPVLGISATLICGHDSPLALLPVPVPRLCLGANALAASFRLWQWQRQHPDLLVIAVGRDSLKLGRSLQAKGKKNARKLICAFFILPPQPAQAKQLDAASLILCGSKEMLGRARQLPLKKAPTFAQALPGLDLGQYPEQARAWDGGHFVFGMGASLMPDSGALSLVRAMSALWQHDDLPPWELRMFGAGPRYAEIMAEAETLGVNSRLAILGSQPLGEVSRHCHVWIAPGVAGDELPAILWSGYAAGLPVICAASELHSERELNAGAVLGVPAGKPQEMAKAMLAMMRDEQLRATKAAAGASLQPEISLAGMAGRVCSVIVDFLQNEPEAQKDQPEAEGAPAQDAEPAQAALPDTGAPRDSGNRKKRGRADKA